MDKTNLSKLKYIYRLYVSADAHIHCEKYSIVYINSRVVYFKDARKQEFLNYTSIDKVYNNIEQYIESNPSSVFFDKYFWYLGENFIDIYDDYKERAKKIRAETIAKSEMAAKLSRLNWTRNEYKKALEALGMSTSLENLEDFERNI